MAVAQINEQGFAELLEKVEEMRVIEHKPHPPVEVKPPLPKVGFDRRFRRI
jgi:hypothetical protein